METTLSMFGLGWWGTVRVVVRSKHRIRWGLAEAVTDEEGAAELGA